MFFGRKPRIMYVPAGEDPKQARINYYQNLKRGSSAMGNGMLPLILAGLAFVAVVVASLWWFFWRGEPALAARPQTETGLATKYTPTPLPTFTPATGGITATRIAPGTPSLLFPSPKPVSATLRSGSPTPSPLPTVPEIAPMGAGAVTMFGSISFQSGCPVTNLGFIASGNLYYLLITGDLDFPAGNPEGQMAMIRGYTSNYVGCDAPILSINSLRWLGATEQAEVAEQRSGRGVGAVITAHGTLMPTPTPTVYYATATAMQWATATPTPRPATPAPTNTPKPTATNAPVSMAGTVFLRDGCNITNWIVETEASSYYLIMPTALSIDFDPHDGRSALISGSTSKACDGDAITVNSITWLSTPTPTITPSPTPTNTATPTPTNTATPTATNTPTTPEPTATSTATPEARATDTPIPVDPPPGEEPTPLPL